MPLILIQCSHLALENTRWILIEAGGQRIEPTADGEGHYILLKGQDDASNLEGFGGCNSIGGSYRIEGATSIKFEPVSTRMFCEGRMEIENSLLRVLTDADTYQVKGKDLLLYKGDQLLGKFHAG